MFRWVKLARSDARPAPCAFVCQAGVLAILMSITSPTLAQEQAKELQRRGAARIAAYLEHIKKTRDKASGGGGPDAGCQ
jgi:hypothetical protein